MPWKQKLIFLTKKGIIIMKTPKNKNGEIKDISWKEILLRYPEIRILIFLAGILFLMYLAAGMLFLMYLAAGILFLMYLSFLDRFLTKLERILTKLERILTKLERILTKLERIITKLGRIIIKIFLSMCIPVGIIVLADIDILIAIKVFLENIGIPSP